MAYALSRRACFFRLGEQTLALGSEHLRQIVAVGSLTRVPRVGPELLGLFSVRGAILPLIDLRPLLGLSGASLQPAQASVAALIDFEGHQLVLHLEEVFGFFPYRDAPDKPGSPELQAFSRGTAVHQELEATVIDIGKVMRALENCLEPV